MFGAYCAHVYDCVLNLNRITSVYRLKSKNNFLKIRVVSCHLNYSKILRNERDTPSCASPVQPLLHKQLTCTSVVIHIQLQCLHDILQSFRQDRIRHALSQREIKHLQVGSKRILVHAVYDRHFGKNKE